MNSLFEVAGVLAICACAAAYVAFDAARMRLWRNFAVALTAMIGLCGGAAEAWVWANKNPGVNLWRAIAFGEEWSCTGTGSADRICMRDVPPCLQVSNSAYGHPDTDARPKTCADAR